MDTLHIPHAGVRMVAHRGVSGLELENTASAFVAAGNRSYFGIETDVHVTRDGQLVCLHDESTKRVSDADINVEQSDYADFRDLALRDSHGGSTRRDLRVPLLTDYINICEKYGKIGVLELKNPMSEATIGQIAEAYRAAGAEEHVIFISFCYENLVCLRRHFPEAPMQFLVYREAVTDELIERLTAHHFDLDIYYKQLDAEAIRRLHAAGILVNCWTVNTAEEAAPLVRWGVDFITTNILE